MGWNCGYTSLKLCHPWDRSAGICLESTALHKCSSIATVCCNCTWRIKVFTNCVCVEVRFNSDVLLAPFSGCSGTFCTAQLGALIQTHLVPANPTSVLQLGLEPCCSAALAAVALLELFPSSILRNTILICQAKNPSHSCLFLHRSQLSQSSPVG